MITLLLSATDKRIRSDGNKVAVSAFLSNVPGVPSVAATAQGEVTFEGSQDFRLSFGTSGAGDAITVGRKYRVTIEEVAE